MAHTQHRRQVAAICVAIAAVITPLVASGPAVAQASYCAPPVDTVPPQITGVTLSTRSVDLSKGAGSLTITVDAKDTATTTASGVKFIKVEADGPRDERVIQLSLSSGTDDDGVWTGTFDLPKTSNSGAWFLRLFEIVDHAGNGVFYIRNTGIPTDPYDPRLRPGWAQTFAVTGTPTSPTHKPGGPTAFSLSPTSVNTTHKAKTVAVSATFSGPRPRSVSVDLRGSVDGGRNFFVLTSLTRGAGGQWAGEIRIRKWAGDSVAHPLLIVRYPHNVRPDYKFFYPPYLRVLHLASALTITSRRDTMKPVLSKFSFTPSSVDTSTGSQVVTISATPTDTQSGTSAIDVRFYLPTKSPNAVEGDPFVRLTKNGKAWTGTVKIPGCVTAGDWEPGVYLVDRTGRHMDYTRKKLAAAGLPADLTVTSSTPRDIIPPEITGATASGQTHKVTLDFSEGVTNLSPTTLTVFSGKPTAKRYKHPFPITGVTCSNGTSPVDCSGGSGLVTSAVLVVPKITKGKSFEVWANLYNVTTQITDGSGNPIDPEYGPQATGVGS